MAEDNTKKATAEIKESKTSKSKAGKKNKRISAKRYH